MNETHHSRRDYARPAVHSYSLMRSETAKPHGCQGKFPSSVDCTSSYHLNAARRNHLLPQVRLVLADVAVPSCHGFVLTDHDVLGDLVEQSAQLSVRRHPCNNHDSSGLT